MSENSLKQKRIGIIGLGLIGGSLALKLAMQGFKIIGIDSNLKQIPTEHPFEIVSDKFEDLKACDFIFVCTPLRLISKTIEQIQTHLKPGCIVTDVGSVKTIICQAASKYMRPDCFFVGGHPMAGTEKSGFENAVPEVFNKRTWVLMKGDFPGKVDLKELIAFTGAEVLEAEPAEHDKAAALISHLPLLLSIKLLNTLQNHRDLPVKNLAAKMASSGFEGMTRLARGNPSLNKDLLELNSKNLKSVLEEYVQGLNEYAAE